MPNTAYYLKTPMVSFTNNTANITAREGFKKLFILVDEDSSTNATISGSQDVLSIGGLPISSIVLKPGQSMELGYNDNDIDAISIIAPLGCTVLMYGHKYLNVD
jgi:hypothetical protein